MFSKRVNLKVKKKSQKILSSITQIWTVVIILRDVSSKSELKNLYNLMGMKYFQELKSG